MSESVQINRRTALAVSASTSISLGHAWSEVAESFQFRYLLATCLYGFTPLDEIMPEVKKCGGNAIDIWPKVHGNQREQLDAMGEDRFAELIGGHGVDLACITQYKLGPFGIEDEIRLANRLGCKLIVTGGSGPRNLAGEALKGAIAEFLKKMAPTIKLARENGVRIAIENHGNNLIHDADSLRYLADLAPKDVIGVALAPYHLPQESEQLCRLIRDVGDHMDIFYAWQHGMGCTTKLPKAQELLQMPGRGDLDFGPLVRTLVEIGYKGWTEIFMHPVPRGVPILESTSKVTDEINSARAYLERFVG